MRLKDGVVVVPPRTTFFVIFVVQRTYISRSWEIRDVPNDWDGRPWDAFRTAVCCVRDVPGTTFLVTFVVQGTYISRSWEIRDVPGTSGTTGTDVPGTLLGRLCAVWVIKRKGEMKVNYER